MDQDEQFNYFLKKCENGNSLVVAAYLIEAGDKKDFLLCTQHTTLEGEVFTPFLAAVHNGHTHLVRLLLEQFDIDQSKHCGKLCFDGYMIEAASPLWCASACGYEEMVRLLVEHGADVNQSTSTNSTPLRAACFCGRLSIVRHLVEHGADLNISNRYKNTCLMLSSYRGNVDIVEYLLSCQADPNVLDSSGGTALHLACENGHLSIVQLLLSAGADISVKNKGGLTAPLVAADGCRSEIVEYFTRHTNLDEIAKITLFELLGSSFANNKDCYDVDKTYHYLLIGMLLRTKDKCPKEVLPPVDAYNGRTECRTLEELESIRTNYEALHMEALAVRERILGLKSVEIIHPIVYRGAVYADNLQFNRCIRLWKRALYLRQLSCRSAHNDLLRFAEVFSQITLLTEKISVGDLCDVTNSCVEEVLRCKEEIAKHKILPESSPGESTDDVTIVSSSGNTKGACSQCGENQSIRKVCMNSAIKQADSNLQTLLYFACLYCRMEKHFSGCHKFGSIIYRFLKLNVRNSNGNTLLHMAVDEKTHVDDFHVKDICSFPEYDVTNFLLSCGADPNVRNSDGNTPLHIIVQYEKPISDFVTLHHIISALLEYGAHFDSCNNQRKTPLELSTTGVAEVILKSKSYVTLKCLAAKALKRYGIAYENVTPTYLQDFVDMH